MATYKYLGNELNNYYFTRIYENTNVLLEEKFQNSVYKYHVDIGLIKSTNDKIVIFEFSKKIPLLNLTILHHMTSEYRIKNQNDFVFYDNILKKYLKKNKAIGKLEINRDASSEMTLLNFSKEESNLREEDRLNNRVVMDNLTIQGFDIKLSNA